MRPQVGALLELLALWHRFSDFQSHLQFSVLHLSMELYFYLFPLPLTSCREGGERVLAPINSVFAGFYRWEPELPRGIPKRA
jgi:hypothetical protein